MLCCRAEFACFRCGRAGYWASFASHVDDARPAAQREALPQIDNANGITTLAVGIELRREAEAAGI